MALAVVVPTEVEVGDTIKITASGATVSGVLDISASNENGNGGLSVSKVALAADGSGNFDSTGKFDFQAQEEGHVDIAVTDVTAATTINERVEVFRRG